MNMKEYTIVKACGQPDWESVPALSISERVWCDPVNVEAKAQICYDEEKFFVRLTAKESAIRAEDTSILGAPCEDSCLEFFFSPMDGDLRYFNIEFNPNCCMWLGFGSGISNLIRLIPDTKGNILKPLAERTEDGWRITYTVPFTFVKQFFPEFKAFSGKVIRANCYKCGDKTEKPHWYTWNPVDPEGHSFHRPVDFGRMILG